MCGDRGGELESRFISHEWFVHNVFPCGSTVKAVFAGPVHEHVVFDFQIRDIVEVLLVLSCCEGCVLERGTS